MSLAEPHFGVINWLISFNKWLSLCAICVSSVSSVVKFLFLILVAADFNFEAIALRALRAPLPLDASDEIHIELFKRRDVGVS